MKDERIRLAHGSGGRLTQELIEQLLKPAFDNRYLRELTDAAVLDVDLSGRIAMTTDSFVVSPVFFPGGDIGSLAVTGTVNDLAVMGASPLYLSCGLLLEEGLLLSDLERIIRSMASAAQRCGVALVTGDTKVLPRGKADQVFINTTGIGVVPPEAPKLPAPLQEGDAVIVSGSLGDHGATILCQQGGIELTSSLTSDCAPIHELVAELLQACSGVRFLRDPTRGGLSAVLNEIAEASGVQIWLDEAALPIREEVASACEILGIDPLYLANEGRVVAVVADEQKACAIEALKRHEIGRGATIVGTVAQSKVPRVVLTTRYGGRRIVDMPVGEQLPRIC